MGLDAPNMMYVFQISPVFLYPPTFHGGMKFLVKNSQWQIFWETDIKNQSSTTLCSQMAYRSAKFQPY